MVFRQEMEKEKVTIYNRRKLEHELLKKYQEEMRKLHELGKEKILPNSGNIQPTKSCMNNKSCCICAFYLNSKEARRKCLKIVRQ